MSKFPFRVRALAAAALVCCAGQAGAIGLLQAYNAALANDPAYRSAIHEYEAGQQNKAIGRSQLLPQISANYSASKNRTDIITQTPLGDSPSHPVYFSRSSSVQLRQPILNLDSLARYKQSVAQTDYSAAVFDSRKQEMIVRLVSAYLDALLQSEQLRLTQAQRDAYIEQKNVNDRLFEKGEGTRTDMIETQARLDLSEAQVLEAQDSLQTALATLSALVGEKVMVLDDLAPQFRIAPMGADSYEDWKDIALKNNPEIRAQEFGVEAARQDVNKNRAGHAPRVDFVTSYSKNTADTINTYNQQSTVRAVGIQVSIPLFSGGYATATTRQSAANYEKSKSDLQTNTDKVLVELKRQYSAVLSSSKRVLALEKAVASGELLITATEQSIKGGVRINLDLLNARQQLYTSRRDQAQARYNYLLSTVKMKAAAGVLGVDDLREVAGYFR
ncbi:TolC family outer membrane protein [Pseudoduganella sp. FT55W]|uniref:TolC family outer membrane protein n=1 Tax=Duganella rivi TaxID=2666083 RepID=A0A7X4GSI0_9BURK|nr:TolC family outer membrane protein [Duganella rivi]MYM68816.1 TolC family outer membrane protein [Duganella rivi]